MLATLLLGVLMGQADHDAEASRRKVQALFEAQEKALRAGDEAACKALWHAEGWAKNLVGGSGLAGNEVFAQGSRKKWFPRPRLDTVAPQGKGSAIFLHLAQPNFGPTAGCVALTLGDALAALKQLKPGDQLQVE